MTTVGLEKWGVRKVKELVVISGKGGTGKTSIVAAFAALAQEKVLADCDVDAADLHLVLRPEVRDIYEFRSGKTAVIDPDACSGCGQCRQVCRFDAITGDYEVQALSCEGCGACAHFCPENAVKMQENLSGHWFISDTRFGPLVHAKLGIAEENSGKLVSLVRNKARVTAGESGCSLVIIDGSPGIGCPVIASITGGDLLMLVTEPTCSGLHDLERIAALARHFEIPAVVCINKVDINPEMAEKIELACRRENLELVGKVPYDPDVTRAQVAGASIIEYTDGAVSREIGRIWEILARKLEIR